MTTTKCISCNTSFCKEIGQLDQYNKEKIFCCVCYQSTPHQKLLNSKYNFSYYCNYCKQIYLFRSFKPIASYKNLLPYLDVECDSVFISIPLTHFTIHLSKGDYHTLLFSLFDLNKPEERYIAMILLQFTFHTCNRSDLFT